MARLTRTLVTERENFVRTLFRADPGLTGQVVQTKLTETYGKIMRPNRIYELKREVAAEIVASFQPSVPVPVEQPVNCDVLDPTRTAVPTVASTTV